ncbi:MAG: hypothetical protein ACOYXW_14835 [Actinomycetota bacterium]
MDRDRYDALTAELVAWARDRDDVIGVVGLGSTAGTSREPDEWSDHDVFVVTVDGRAEVLRRDLSWVPYPERHAVRYTETLQGRGVIYDDGHLVELAVFDDSELDPIAVNAFRVLYDRGGLADRLAAMQARTSTQSVTEDSDGAYRVHQLVKHLTSLVASFVPAEKPGSLDNLDSLRRFEQVYPAVSARIAAALDRPVPQAVEELLALAEQLLAGRAPAATHEAFDAVRHVLARVRGAAPERVG